MYEQGPIQIFFREAATTLGGGWVFGSIKGEIRRNALAWMLVKYICAFAISMQKKKSQPCHF